MKNIKDKLQKARSIILEKMIEKGIAPGPKNQKVNPAGESFQTAQEKRKNRNMFETMQGKIKYTSKGDIIKDQLKPFKMKGFSPVKQVEYGPGTRQAQDEAVMKEVNKLVSGVVDAQDVSDALLANIKRTAAINKAKKGIEQSRVNRNAKDIYKNRTAEEVAKSLVDRNIDDEKFYRGLDAEDEEGTVYSPNKPIL